MDADDLLTTEQAARALGMTPRRVRQLITGMHLPAGLPALPARKLGRDHLIARTDLEPYRAPSPRGRPRTERTMSETIPAATPDPPAWVAANPSCLHAWRVSLPWRADAARARTPQWRATLTADAERLYPGAR